MRKNRYAFIIFIFWMLNLNFGLTQEDALVDSKISELRIFNRAILLVKENYVEPERFDPKAMLLAALKGIEQRVPEFVITELPKETISVQVGSKKREFSIGGLTSLWDLSFRLRDIFKFMEKNLLPDTEIQDIEYAAANGALSVLDPHSILFEPKISAEVKNTTRGEFGGLGVQIGLRDGALTVISPVEGTPAFKAGIKPLDKIIKIEEESTVNLGLEEAVELLRGKPGTSVAITLERKGEPEPIRVVIVRDIIKVDSVTSHLLAEKYGYLNIKTFHGNTDLEMKDAIAKMQKKSKNKLAGLILDFRNNPGGLLMQSIAVSDLFLDGGVVVITQGANESNREEETANAGPGKTKIPVVILVNGGSASASEIVAGAIKNRGRGIVIGEQTFGKGSVQILYDFPDKSSLKLTIAQYLTPGNESIQSVGITPDILLRPMYADDKTKMLLFPGDQTREEDLAAHLNDETRIVNRKPVYELSYLAKILTQSELEKRAVLSSFNNDYEISFAQKILEATDSSSREDLLKAAKTIIKQREASESALLLIALKKFNIDWAAKPIVKGKKILSTKIEAKVKSSPLVLAGNDLMIDIEVKNIGKSPIYRVFGITNS
ncbi:MAG: S41 family peptidase, partial [bacterium]|nr:S41 family peptidase [bacterium]